MVWLGVDGGGTKTEVLVASNEAVLGFARGGASNHQVVGISTALDTVVQVSEAALKQAGLGWDAVDGAVFGMAGADFPEDIASLQEGIRQRIPIQKFTVVNDAEIALKAGTTSQAAIAAIAGTGPNVFGVNPAGETRQVGGLGYEWGDFGSGIDIAREVLHAAFRSAELRGEKTVLEEMVLQLLGMPDYRSLSRALYFREIPEAHFFIVVPFCFQAAAGGDQVAKKILNRVGRSIADSVCGCARLLRIDDTPIQVVMAGSLWLGQADDLKAAFFARLHEVLPLAEAHVTELKPVAGAVLEAVIRSGGDATMIRERMRQEPRLSGVE